MVKTFNQTLIRKILKSINYSWIYILSKVLKICWPTGLSIIRELIFRNLLANWAVDYTRVTFQNLLADWAVDYTRVTFQNLLADWAVDYTTRVTFQNLLADWAVDYTRVTFQNLSNMFDVGVMTCWQSSWDNNFLLCLLDVLHNCTAINLLPVQ